MESRAENGVKIKDTTTMVIEYSFKNRMEKVISDFLGKKNRKVIWVLNGKNQIKRVVNYIIILNLLKVMGRE